MAEEQKTRIINLAEKSAPDSGDFFAVDSQAGGSKKIPATALAKAADLTAEAAARTQADNALTGAINSASALIQNPTKTLSGALVSFTDGADMPMVACTASIVPKQSGSGTPSPDNVRQISGWESVTLEQRGKSLINVADQTITSQRTIASNITLESGTYTVSANVKNNTAIVGYFRLVKSGTTIAEIQIPSNANERRTTTLTLSEPTTFNIVCNGASSGYNYAVSDIMIEAGNTATAYEPYTGTTTTVNLGRTVYGGTLDVVSGVLTVDRAMVDLGTLTWSAYGATSSYDRYITAGIDSTAKEGTVGICSHFQGSRSYSAGNIVIGSGSSKLSVFTEKGQYASASAFKTAMNGATYVYPLANPQTYQLTPTEVKTLLGDNNVWADSGDVEITYRRDISIVLENLENALSGSNSLNTMMMSAPTENTAEEPTEGEAEDDMR